jgi:catechol 2,3-dioxygenase-like lactoylglutathione lyase family enzyme
MRLRRAAPVFLVADVAATLRWYRENLGFDGLPFPEQPAHFFGIMTRDDVEIMLQQLDGCEKPPTSTNSAKRRVERLHPDGRRARAV